MCEQYWPSNEGGVENFSHMKVKNTKETKIFGSNNKTIEDTIKRKLEVSISKPGRYH